MSVVPTKMELSKLRKRLKTAREAHKLLKDKQDELMRRFISLLRETNEIRQGVNASVKEFSVQAGLSVAGFPYKMVRNLFLVKETLISANITRQNWMGVSLVDINFDYPNEPQPSSALVSSPLLSQTENDMRGMLHDLLRMTQMEKNCCILANEIEALRRRVNALEHMVIPNLEQDIRMIRMKLSDNERDTITRLIKIKGMEE
jgi:V/A-type H+-transporting ATPase subunit D